jgi:hypothetical protein
MAHIANGGRHLNGNVLKALLVLAQNLLILFGGRNIHRPIGVAVLILWQPISQRIPIAYYRPLSEVMLGCSEYVLSARSGAVEDSPP